MRRQRYLVGPVAVNEVSSELDSVVCFLTPDDRPGRVLGPLSRPILRKTIEARKESKCQRSQGLPR